MTKGWRLESARHSLARKGIKTKQQKVMSAKYQNSSGDLRYTNTNWRQTKKDKNIIEWESDQEKKTIFKLGNSWILTGGNKLISNISYAPIFYTRKKDALKALKIDIEFKGIHIIPREVLEK
jgi:hypothetical protein